MSIIFILDIHLILLGMDTFLLVLKALGGANMFGIRNFMIGVKTCKIEFFSK